MEKPRQIEMRMSELVTQYNLTGNIILGKSIVELIEETKNEIALLEPRKDDDIAWFELKELEVLLVRMNNFMDNHPELKAIIPEPQVVEKKVTVQEELTEFSKEEIKIANEVINELNVEFKTSQENVVIPTKELIKRKDTDFRVMLSLSTISNCDDTSKTGANNRYVSFSKVDKNVNDLQKEIGIDNSNWNKKIKALVKAKSTEFEVIDKEYKGKSVKCYSIAYDKGGFVLIPIEKAKKMLITLGNNPIKLYCNLLWMCQENGEFIEKPIAQSTLATSIGLSPSSQKVVKASIEVLVELGYIKTRKDKIYETVIDKNGLPILQPKDAIYYSIVL